MAWLAGSNACAFTPLLCNAFKTPSPDINEISRSAERPPIKTATLAVPTSNDCVVVILFRPHFPTAVAQSLKLEAALAR